MLDRAAWHGAAPLVRELVTQVVAPTGCEVEVRYDHGVPPVVNESVSTRIFTHAIEAIGPDVLTDTRQSGGGEDFSWYLEDVPGLPFDAIVFGVVPEPKTTKNRVHWDVWGDTEALLAAGARLIRRRDDEIDWDVLADPEGNEFDVFTRAD